MRQRQCRLEAGLGVGHLGVDVLKGEHFTTLPAAHMQHLRLGYRDREQVRPKHHTPRCLVLVQTCTITRSVTC